MSKLVRVLGVFFIVMGVWVAVSPESLIDGVDLESRQIVYFGAGFRLLIGVILILAAKVSRFPKAFRILGGLTMLVGLALPFIPEHSWVELIRWVIVENLRFYRFAGGLMGILFGAFITYAAVPRRAAP